MQAIIVDDNPEFARKVAASIRAVPRVHKKDYYEKTPLAKIVKEINDLAAGDKDTIVLINIDLNYADRSRQQQMGVEVLKHLRLTEYFSDPKKSQPIENKARDLHCVMYSFFTLEQILRRRPDNYILCSTGTTFICLPSDFSVVPSLTQNKAKLDSLAPYIRGELTLPDERHDWANWWGIRQLYEVHKHVAGNLKLPYPNKVEDEQQQLRSKQAIYLFGYRDEEIGAAYQKLSAQIADVRTVLGSRVPKILHVDDRWEDGWSKIFMRMIYSNASLSKQSSDTIDPSSSHIDYLLDDKPIFRVFNSFGTDRADEGAAKERMDVIYAGIKEAVNFGPHLVLLDLRLFNEPGVRYEAASLSGAKVLQWLRKQFQGIPIIMTTASNKVWSLEQLIQLGADAFWVKEGLDERKTPDGTVRNYLRLLQLVSIATGEKYGFLNRFDLSRLKLLQNKSPYWWEHYDWNDNGTTVTTEANRDTVEAILADTVLMLRSYLQQYEMGYGYRNQIEERSWAAAILRNAANVIEEVHQISAVGLGDNRGLIGGYRDKRSGSFVTRRGDWFGYVLYAVRNEASHHRGAQTVTWEILKEFLASLMCYLLYGPETTFRNIEMREITRTISSEFDYSLGRLEMLRASSPNSYDPMFKRIMG
jgi:CheY-like chemotaxis protein